MTLATLRSVANRLVATSINELPHHVGYLATALSSCQDVLSIANPSHDQAAVLHKFRTRVSSLLQDRTPEGRLVGIVIAKALVENGGQAILSEATNWARSIISCLGKPDECEVKRLGVITLTRLYCMTHENQMLVRELTTPTLPAYITVSLAAIKPNITTVNGSTRKALSPLLPVVLQSWSLLVPRFASTIRPSALAMKSICLSVISNLETPQRMRSLATELVALLPTCAPKNFASAEVETLFLQTCESAHDTADLVFRAVIEDWTAIGSRTSKVTKKQRTAPISATQTADAVGLDSWTGLKQGRDRLCAQIHMLSSLLIGQRSQQTALPLAHVLDLTGRLSAVCPPTAEFFLRANNEITKEEREELWLVLPEVHCAVVQLLMFVVKSYSLLILPLASTILTQVLDIFQAQRDQPTVRSSVYRALTALLPLKLHKVEKSQHKFWVQLMQSVQQDLSSAYPSTTSTLHMSGTLDLALQSKGSSTGKDFGRTTLIDTQVAATEIMSLLIADESLPDLPGYQGLRAQLESAAILNSNHAALLASVLFPNKRSHGSLLPFLARGNEICVTNGVISMTTEAILRPRMPMLAQKLFKPEERSDDAARQQGVDDTLNHEQMARESDLRDKIEEHSPEAAEPADRREMSKPIVEHDPTSNKRDFSSLLLTGTDKPLDSFQLPASSATEEGELQNVEVAPWKKHRLDLAANPTTETIQGLAQPAQMELLDDHLADVEMKELDGHTSPPQHDLKGKSQATLHDTYDGDSSDSEIPTIDPTLADMTDSEDED